MLMITANTAINISGRMVNVLPLEFLDRAMGSPVPCLFVFCAGISLVLFCRQKSIKETRPN